MNALLQTVERLSGMISLKNSVPGDLPCALFRVPSEPRLHIVHALYEAAGRDIFYVFSSEYEARTHAEQYMYGEKIFLPAPQTELRPMETQGSETQKERVASLDRLKQKGGVVFLSIESLLFKMRPVREFFNKYKMIRQEQVIAPQKLLDLLLAAGYESATLVESPGQMSGRGEIVEVFPPNSRNPYRVTFFDEEVESIRSFDPDTQRSFGGVVESISIPPALEFFLNETEARPLKEYLSAANRPKLESVRESYVFELQEQGSFSNIEAYTDILENNDTVLHYARDPLLVFENCAGLLEDYQKREESRRAMFAEILAEGGAFGCEASTRWFAEDLIQENRNRCIDFESVKTYKAFSSAKRIDFDIRNTVGFLGNITLLIQAVRDRTAAGYRVFLCAGGRSKRLSETLSEQGLLAPVAQHLDLPGAVVLPLTIKDGFETSAGKTVFFSEEDIFGVRYKKSTKTRGNTGKPTLLADLKAGDIVVHEIHGKGKYVGLKTMTVAGVSAEYMEITYRDGDKLFIPTAQIGRVDKYVGSEGDSVRLSKLGGREWETAKEKARASVKKLTENLAEIYHERSVSKGYRFSPDTVWQKQFEDNFMYEETPGQIKCIEQIKNDMESGKIMDRLLLGDVGYGKTEVAIRACFKAVMDSKQVAILVPTTLLARQHYRTFVDRFAGFPMRIEMLSRYSQNPAAIVENLRTGKTDIVIGTHKLLGKRVKFKDLGLLVIDEEHRFGVSHKERIKDIRRNVDVLTLTATPIPRTLEMAMTGIREMCTIDTPPDIRKEVQAFVTAFDWGLVRDVVLKEMNRGGQIYFVCRQIREMEALAKGLRKSVPEARVISAHGRMNESESEAAISSFLERKYDVLLCTTIIESGIDIPSVNSIIVYEADKFGLAQLYQLKGRIGRSNLRGYAYFTYLSEEYIGEAAAKRLEAVREFTQFGSGMKIAMRDLEIRGAGNLLGAEQSGHMANVGYAMYMKMFREEVLYSMGHALPRRAEASVELNEDAFIPNAYIGDEALKLDMYKKVAEAVTIKKARSVREEFIDRFGPLPKEVENLLIASVIRGYASQAGLMSVVRLRDTVNLKFAEDTHVKMPLLKKQIQARGNDVQLRYTTPPYIAYKMKKKGSYTEMLQLIDQLRHCISPANPV